MLTQDEAHELREKILDQVLKVYFIAAEAKGWDEPPPEVETIMHEIFHLVSDGLNIKE